MVDCEIDQNGSKFWYKNGNYHREDGPAVEWCDGTKMWYSDNKMHREDGPAVEWPDGLVEYWLDDVRLTEIEYFVKCGVMNG